MKLSDYEKMVTGRETPLFAEDIASNYRKISDSLKTARVAVIGAAGSIGSAVVKSILEFEPKGLVLDAFADALIYLSKNQKAREEMGKKARKLALSDFNRIKLADQFVCFLEKVVSL
ncbi:MAG: polysaccharide biosynthesis protein [Planctomycetes bacterium]|nr:polysaccharide biosynthesis protein [Planctomycetota bacterium]